jgi:hypothetical protein
MAIHKISNYINESSEHRVFQYDYAFSFQDKVYASKILNKNIISLSLNSIETKNKINQINDINTNTALTEELNVHLSKVFNANVKNIEINTDDENYKDDIWLTSQSVGDFIPLHTSNGEFSFIIFGDDFETNDKEDLNGCIEFISSKSNDTMIFNPEPNTIFIFKSNHMRMIYPSTNKNDRTIITGNIKKFELHL